MLSHFSPRILGASLFFALTSITASAQVTFTTHTYPNNNLWTENSGPNSTLRADLNGDGREDFIFADDGNINSGCSGSFAVSLSTGDGTYAAPVCYTVPTPAAVLFTAGDFFRSGTLDLAVTNEFGDLYIYKNNGHGTLTVASTLAFPFEIAGIVAADVNHDGRIDLVYLYQNTSNVFSLHTLLGNGDGTFTTGPVSPAGTVFNGPFYMMTGDFDGDGHADVMIINHVLYGDGKGNFIQGPYANKTEAYQPLDVNNDGTMDLIGTPATANNQTLSTTYFKYLDLVWGHFNRTFTTQNIPLKSCAETSHPAESADFDGDGIPDLIIAEDSDCKGDGPYTLNFMKGNGNGTFQAEQVIYSTPDEIQEWHVVRASHSSKPDLTVLQYLDVNRTITNPEELVLVNTTAGNFPPCTPINYAAMGISVCGPTSSSVPSSPVNFSFSGAGQTRGRDMELWIDGKKVAENLKNTYSYYDFLNASVPLANGTHTVDVFSVGWDNFLILYDQKITVGSSACPAPSYNGLNICAPLQHAQLSSPVAVASTLSPSAGPVTRMELWIDGTKYYSTFGSSQLNTQVTLAPGHHQLSIVWVPMSGGGAFADTEDIEVK